MTGTKSVLTVAVTSTNLTIAWIFTFFWLSQMWIYILAIFLFIDTITWWIKAWIYKEATSANWTRWVVSKSLLILVPFIISGIWLWLWLDMKWLTASSLSLLIFSEGYSILANIYEIYSRKKLPEYDAVSIILKWILDAIKKLLDNKIK